jgi:hypothetical protein
MPSTRQPLLAIFPAVTPEEPPSSRGVCSPAGTPASPGCLPGRERYSTCFPQLNKISPFSLTFIVAKVYRDASWMDGAETIVIDYSKTSFVARKIRDEIREIEPGVYLGKVWWGRTRILDFALTQKQ